MAELGGALVRRTDPQVLQRSAYRSVQSLEKDLREWTATWNENPRPFVWRKADEILESWPDTANESLNQVTSVCCPSAWTRITFSKQSATIASGYAAARSASIAGTRSTATPVLTGNAAHLVSAGGAPD